MATTSPPPTDWRRYERLTRKQASAVLNMSTRWLDRLLAKGELTRLKPRQGDTVRMTYLDTREVEAYLDGGPEAAEAYRDANPAKFHREANPVAPTVPSE